MNKNAKKQQQLEMVIANKLQEMGLQQPNEIFEVLGGATLLLLKVTGEYIGWDFDAMRNEYVRGLMAAKCE